MKINKKFIFLFIIVLITTILEGKVFFLSILYSMIIVFLLEFVLMQLYTAGLKTADVYNIERLECGAKFTLRYKVLNSLFLRIPNVSIKTNCEGCSKSKSDFISLAPRKNTVISEEVCFNHRGVYNIGEKSVYLKSLFGIIEKKYKLYSSKNVKVYPNEYEFEFYFLGNRNNNVGFSGRKSMNDYDIKGIKEYTQGDSIRHINWKNTAKGNKIMVNEYNGEAGDGDYIILDMNALNYNLDPEKTNEEKMVDFVCSLCKYKMQKGEKMNIIINNEKLEELTVDNNDDYLDLVKYFLENESKGSKNINDMVRQEAEFIPIDSGIVIVVNEFTEDLKVILDEISEDKKYKIKVICNKRKELSERYKVTDLNYYVC